MRRRFLRQTAVALVLTLVGGSAWAESARGLVRRGNRAYEAGRYDEAMKAYEQADVEQPESPVVAFNQGTVHYRAEDFAAARESFTKAAKASPEPRFEAKCRYNLGDCWFREVRRQMDSDLAKAVEACERSVDEFQAALGLDPTLESARRNIEVVRRLWKTILDEQKRRQEEQQAQQEQQQKLAEQFKQLIERQERAAGQSSDLARQQTAEGTTQGVQDQSTAQADSQRQLGQDTQALADALQQAAAQAQPPSPAPGAGTPPAPTTTPQPPALPHLADARQAQDQAVQKLGQYQPATASADQKQAAEALRKALESMQQKPDGQPQPQQGQQEQQPQGQQEQQQQGQQEQQPEAEKKQGEEGAEDPQEAEPPPGEEPQERPQQAEPQQDGAPAAGTAQEADQDEPDAKDRQPAKARLADQDARDILDTEKRNRDRRTAAEQRGLTPVDKDW